MQGQTPMSAVDAMMYARVAQLYFIYLRKRPEVSMEEKSKLTSLIAKIKCWIDDKRSYMEVRYPDVKEKLGKVIDIDSDAIADLSMVCDFIVKNQGDTEWINDFIPKSRAAKTLENYHKLRLEGLSEEAALQKLL